MKPLIIAATTLFPEPGRSRPANRSTLLGSAVALGCALAPLLAVIGAYVQTV